MRASSTRRPVGNPYDALDIGSTGALDIGSLCVVTILWPQDRKNPYMHYRFRKIHVWAPYGLEQMPKGHRNYRVAPYGAIACLVNARTGS